MNLHLKRKLKTIVNIKYMYHKVGLRNKRDNNKLLKYLWNI